jgi:hypothetical protein
MSYALSASATLTDNYLSINVEFGNDQAFTPELVRTILVTLKGKYNKNLRTLETSAEYSNSDGCFKLGTIMFDEELSGVSKVAVSAVTSMGDFKTSCDVLKAPDTITASQF